MIISVNLLKQFVDLENISVDELVHKLTFSGLEVEGVSHLAKATGLVIGEIIEVKDHPDSNHLHVLKVDLGNKYGVKQIVCGAPNVKEHLKVIVANEGAVIGNDNVKIIKGTIRGVESFGMCCSLLELGVDKTLLSEKQCQGIEELNDDAKVGEEDVLKYLNLDDVLLEINVLANRSDCLSIYSFAKEVAALFNRKLMIENYEVPSNKKSSYKVTSLTKNCPQFALRVLENIKVKESPMWLKNALRSEGIRSINNIVDIGNYVMLLTGRPLHMYDLDKVKTNTFVIRDDIERDFVALDEKTYAVKNGDVLVTDGEEILCLGGIMGGLNSSVSETTSRIGIECATFNSARIRRTSSRIGLSSDSSQRFIKGINPTNEEETLQLASYLVKTLALSSSFEDIAKFDNRAKEEVKIDCTYSYINHRLGTSLLSKEMDKVFDSLQIKIEHLDEDKFIAYPPSYRIDLKCDADLSEEIFRTIGLDKIYPTLPTTPMTLGGLSEAQRKLRVIREHLVSLGLHEVLTYTLVDEKESEECAFITKNDTCFKVINPMTIYHSVVRKALLPSLFDVTTYNISHQNNDFAIFETTTIETKEQTFKSLGIVLNNNKVEQGLLKSRPYTYYDILGIFESILEILGINKTRIKLEYLKDSSYFHPGRSVKVLLNNKLIGVFGALHPKFLMEKEFSNTYALELNLTSLIELKSSQLKMEQFSKFPFVTRDYAFVINKDINFNVVELAIKKHSSSLIKKVEVFDVYEGEHVNVGYKSIAIRITYASLDHTLKEEEINEAEEKALNATYALGATLRK